MSEYLAFAPDQIAQQAIDAAHAGASILHLHARNPIDGSPTPDPAVFDLFVPKIALQTDAIINITTDGDATLKERLAYPLQAKPELCSLNMGALNFSFPKTALGIANWKHPWERSYVEDSENVIVGNTFADIRDLLAQLGDACGARFEFRMLRRRSPPQPRLFC